VGITVVVIYSYRDTVKLWSLFVSGGQDSLVFIGKITLPN
jgi:hypothetical protein